MKHQGHGCGCRESKWGERGARRKEGRKERRKGRRGSSKLLSTRILTIQYVRGLIKTFITIKAIAGEEERGGRIAEVEEA